jgi:ribosomal protein S20
MWHVIIPSTVVVVGSGAYALYRYFSEDEKPLGAFIVWGRPNTGKSTFIAGLRGVPPPHGAPKEATGARITHKDVKITGLDRGPHKVDAVTDMPGTNDRLPVWLDAVKSVEHVFYLINLARVDDREYMSSVRTDIKQTVAALKESKKEKKRLNLIGSHLDKSNWKAVPAAEVNNFLQEDDQFRELYESMEGFAGYVYAANLTDPVSFKKLLQSIADDILAKG